MKNTKSKYLFKKLLVVKNLQKYVTTTFFISDHLGLSVVKTRKIKDRRFSSETICSMICSCFYIYAIVSELFMYNYSDFVKNSLEEISDFVLLFTGFLLPFAYNFNRYYFSTKTEFLFNKLLNVENNLNSVGIATINKKQKMFINICLITMFTGCVICFIFEYITFNITSKDGIVLGELIAYSLPLLSIVAYCSCSTITFYFLMSLYRTTNIIVIKKFQRLKQNRKINQELVRQIKYLLNIESDICECRNLFLYMTGIVNATVILSILIITVFYGFWIFISLSKTSSFENQFMKLSLINFVIYVHCVLYIMIYVAQEFNLEVNILHIIYELLINNNTH